MALKLPRVAVFQPVVRRLLLPTVDDILLKHPVVIADAVAATRQAEGRQRVEEAGRQAPEPAIAQPRVILLVDQLFKVEPHLFQRVVDIFIDTQRQQRVRESAANQKLHRQVVDLTNFLRKLGAVRAQPALHHSVTHGEQRGVKPFMFVGDRRIFADDEHQLIGDRVLQCLNAQRG